jgi:Domain of unknown function (DUF5668)/B-box zinc finger
MNCQNHPDAPATAYCRTCGKPLCDACRRDVLGTVYCGEHLPAQAAPPPPPASAGLQSPYTGPYTPPPPGMSSSLPTGQDVSPVLALILGMIPGVGAIYNGQYAKGLIHAVIFGIICSITNSRAIHGMEPVFGMMCFAWWAYMVFEAYHTARKRRAGEHVDEYSSLIDMRGIGGHVPLAAVAMIILGVLLLLRTLDVFDFEAVARYWPVLLIALGVYLLYSRFSGGHEREGYRHGR